MRSTRGLAATITLLLTVPAAIAVAVITGGGAEPIIHFGIGAGMVMLATAAFDFGLPRPVAWFGAVTAGTFGGIFLLQGIADAIGNPDLYHFAFFVLGQQLERVLPDLIVVWFIALLLLGSEGKTRILGWVVMTVVVVGEIATLAGPLVGIDVPDIKVRWLLPFVWLLFESVKPAVGSRLVPPHAARSSPTATQPSCRNRIGARSGTNLVEPRLRVRRGTKPWRSGLVKRPSPRLQG